MGRPVVIFGLPKKEFVDQVFKLRKKLLKEGKLEEVELMTLPHLTILINTALDDLVSNDFLSQKIKTLISVIKPFALTISEFEKMDNSIVAKFDNSFSRKLVSQISSVLPGFRPVTSDFIKILRRVVPVSIDEALEAVKREFGNEIIIDRICIAGGALRPEDVLWEGILGQKNI